MTIIYKILKTVFIELIAIKLVHFYKHLFYNGFMILYVDETENNEYFILTGLLFDSEKTANDVYYSFKKKANGYKMSENLKAKLFTEFKSTLMDEKFPTLKRKMIEEIKTVDNLIIYSIYFKRDKRLLKDYKFDLYTRMLSKIVDVIGHDIDVVFDRCSDSNVDSFIVETMSKLDSIKSIKAADSQLTPGLQLVDNICSIIRRKYTDSDKYGFYELISSYIKETVDY